MQVDLHGELVGAADQADRERVAGGVERVEEVVRGRERSAAGAHEQVAAAHAGAFGRAAGDHAAHEQAVALGQPHRGAHAP